MRPLQLSMVAFGPFASVESIDFSEMGEKALFLINGPTGSGKSTILDAICFALYGETTGNEREARQMRCDHADPATLTEIILTFELASGRYRIKRIPEQQRPKARGDGVTEQKAKAELYKIEGENETLIVSPKVTEATQEIINLTGLSAEQFRQVMVLPQGKFRDLLLAKSEEREAIFQQLFQTHVYSTLQNKLREQAGALVLDIKEVQLQQKILLEVHDFDTAEQLSTHINTLKTRLKTLFEEKQKAEEKLKNSQRALQQAKQLDDLFLEQAAAKTTVLTLNEKQADIQQQKNRLDQAIKASEIEPVYAEYQKQKAALEKSRQTLENAKNTLEDAEKTSQKLALENEALPEKQKILAQYDADFRDLKAYRQRSQQLKTALSNQHLAGKNLIVVESLLAEKTQKLKTGKKNLENLEENFQIKNNRISILPEKEVKLEKTTEHGKVLRKRDELQSQLKGISSAIEVLLRMEQEQGQVFQGKRRDKDIYEQAWQNGQAAILASDLQDGMPCVVCGSRDHPGLAKSEEKLPTEKELNQIREALEKVRVQLDKTVRDRLLKQEESKNINQMLSDLIFNNNVNRDGNQFTLDTIQDYFRVCRDEINELKKIKSELPKMSQDISENKIQLKTLENELNECQKTLTDKHGELAASKVHVNNIQAELPEAYRDAVALETAINHLIQEKTKLTGNIEKTQQHYQKARDTRIAAETSLKSFQSNQTAIDALLNEVSIKWQTSLKQSPFNTEPLFISALLAKDQKDELGAVIRLYEDEKLLAHKQLEEKTAQIIKATKHLKDDKSHRDIVQLTEIENQLELEKNNVDAEYHKTDQTYQALISTCEKLKKSIQQQTRLEDEYGVIGKLSDVSHGKNPHNLSLQRFVLSVLLDDVLTEASYRLHKMSKGRFQLYRKETVGDKRTKAGLDLEVEDAYTGKQRPAATLSGGESFMAALALALGLSDVVQSYAGGIRLDMLFIDEGFGSLDPESLDLAISTLIDLKDTGRMVGIISHVEELKRMIDVRLDVVANREVSFTRLIGV